jgi:hypothetical protein
MTDEQKPFEWNLTPTERRIAEVAFAVGHGDAQGACESIIEFRGKAPGWWAHNFNSVHILAMLAELRREHVADDRCRALLERIIEAHDMMMATSSMRFPADHQAAADSRYTDAIEDARRELAR